MEWRKDKPNVEIGDHLECWVAVRYETNYSEKKTHEIVLLARYLNCPLQWDEEDELIEKDYYLIDSDGDSMNAFGWHHYYEHYDFDGYFAPFSDSWEIVGWSELDKPSFPNEDTQ